MIIDVGSTGTPLRDILGNKDYPLIMSRYIFTYNNEEYDELFGYCKYENGELISLDGDCYSLDDLYIKWEETDDMLIIWEDGVVSEDK